MTQGVQQAHAAMRTRAVTAAAVGTALEWFDFTLYGALAATVLPKLFFPAMDSTSALLASLATFGVGLAARPLGAIICGHLGDKLGRRNLMLGTVSLMGLSSVLMGLLPTYASIGVWAPMLLVLLRILQGFALGGESTGAQLMAIEHASPDRRGKYSGLLGLCSPLSQIMANGALLLLASVMSAEAFDSYGWRIPFLLSFVLIVVGVYIRLKVSETPAFVELRKTQVVQVASPLRDVLRLHWRTVLRWMLFFCGPAAIFYLIVVFSLSYITKTLAVPKQTGFLLLMGANVCAIAGALAGGMLSDRIGRRKALAIGSVATLLMLFVYFQILDTRSFLPMLAAMGFFLGFTQFQSGIQPVAFAEAFPTNVRYSGSALAYTGANLIAGGPMPVLAVWLFSISNGSPWGVVAVCVAFNVISLIAILTAPETLGIDMNRTDSAATLAGDEGFPSASISNSH
ncbi:L-Proline/Glycine betaine transporter ProP [Caballeronia glathei]|jgi:MFS family permease|uniref:MFS transporter n=1 Tax=Caballeronia glathei TaxID=60547 RepID=A0A069Q1T6_9BURK|nr:MULTISPECIES: MFS transporter [Burkholderiaceae]KDR43691.1 MFS transporter [Caballeronia glathei]TCK43654.1 sugar phosphate permease [Paraburkholderia sp. BL8N3]CDY75698.1 L-Proline/Glycine betaine transporter ProP [Caballeronia glathei]